MPEQTDIPTNRQAAVSRLTEGRPILARLVAVALAVETLLVCAEGAVPPLARYLPLGGSHLAQLGFVLGLAIVVAHLKEALQKS